MSPLLPFLCLVTEVHKIKDGRHRLHPNINVGIFAGPEMSEPRQKVCVKQLGSIDILYPYFSCLVSNTVMGDHMIPKAFRGLFRRLPALPCPLRGHLSTRYRERNSHLGAGKSCSGCICVKRGKRSSDGAISTIGPL